jgi:hypothetical protein
MADHGVSGRKSIDEVENGCAQMSWREENRRLSYLSELLS